jgi:hypothetical protein
MHLSVEISMYPLQDGYKEKIQDFLDMLDGHDHQIEIRTSNMSTRIFGEFDAVNLLLNTCMQKSMQRYGKIVFVCKYLQGDARELRGYQ